MSPHAFWRLPSALRSVFRPVSLLALLSLHATAATLTWQGGLGPSWSAGTSGTSSNWSGGALPVNGDSLVFDLTTAGAANLSSSNDLTALTTGGANALTFINDSGTSTDFSLAGNAIVLGGNITSSGATGTHTHTLSLGLILNGTRTLTAVTGTTFVIDGVISESGGSFGFIKSGAGAATLSASSTFSGAVSVSQGTLSIASIADSGISSAIGAGSVINLGSGTNVAGTLTYTGSGGLTNRSVNLAATTTGAATLNSSGSGALVFTGTFSNAGSGAKTLTLGGSNAGSNEIQSVLGNGNGSGTLAVTKTNGGTWLLSGLNTYTGNTTINQGVLSINSIADGGSASAIGAGSVINFGSANQTGTLFYSGAAASTNRTLNLAATGTGTGGAIIDASGTGALIFTGSITNAATTGTKTLTLNGTAANNDFQGVISDGGNGGAVAVTKGDTGSWILSGINTFTGAVSIVRGALTVNTLADSSVASSLGAGTTLNLGSGAQGGTLIYTGAGGSTNRAIILASTSTGGGTLTSNGSGALLFTGSFSNAGSAAKTFTLNGSNTGANEFQSVLVDSSGGGLSVVKSGAGAWTLSGASSFTGALSVNQGTLTLTSLADSGVGSAAGAGGVINLGSGTTVASALVYTGSGASTNRTIHLAATTTGGAVINSSGGGALIFTGVISNAGTGGKTLTLGGSSTAGNEVQSVIGDGSGALALAKADAGTWILTGLNSYSNGTSVSNGTLILNSASAIGTGTLTLTGGTLDTLSDLTLSTNNAIALNGSFIFGGTNDLNLGSGGVTLGNASRDITLNGSGTLTLGALQWNAAANNRSLTVNQGTGSGGALVLGGLQLNTNTDSAARNRTLAGTGSVIISGAVENGNAFANGIIWSGSGTLTLTAASTYTGTTTVNGGTFKLSGGGGIATSASLAVNAGVFDVGGTTAALGGALTLGAATTSVAGQTAGILSSVAGGSLSLGGNVTYNAGSAGFENGQASIAAALILTADRTLTVNDSPNAAVDVLVSGIISGGFGLTKGGTGTLRLSGDNAFTGQAQFNNDVTEITSLGNIGSASSLGTADKDSNSGIIRFGNNASTGTLNYLGDGDSTNRRIQTGSGTGATATGGATILSNGSGALVFTATTFNSAVTVSANGASTARVLTLGGGSTEANTIQGAIINNTGAGTSGTNAVALVKQDAGVWVLAGASTYSGGTTITGGTLLANNTTGSATGTGRVTITSGAALGGSGTAGSLTAGASFTQQGGAVIFAGQHGVLDAQTLTLQAAAGFSLSGTVVLDITGGAASGVLNAQSGSNDLLTFSGGAVALSGASLSIRTTLPLTSGEWVAGTSWHLINWSSVSGTFDTVTDVPDLTALGLAWDWSQFYSSGTLDIIIAAVPEPSRALLLMSGLSSLMVLRGRRRAMTESCI